MLDRRRFLAATAVAAAGWPLRARRAAGVGPALAETPRAAPRAHALARPTPTAAQLRWQRDELALFLHVGVNTYTDREWGDGTESPSLFNPVALDARSWARTARDAGFRSLLLTAKHHDGFCLWPTSTTTHSVAASAWRAGRGDVVREVAEACRLEGLGFGVYLSPWDRHEPRYGDSPAYMTFYLAQLEELCTRYGPLAEVWFDGANGEGPNGRTQAYDWARIHGTVRRLQPEAVIFSDAGPDVRWIGNEHGVAGETCWSTINPAAVPYAGYDAPGVGEVLQHGHADGTVWRPGETDVSIRPGWFHHAAENDKVKDAAALLRLYESSVGRNSKLLLNVPPDASGMLGAPDIASLSQFGQRRRDLLAENFAAGARVMASSTAAGHDALNVLDPDLERHWEAAINAAEADLTVMLSGLHTVSVIRLQEPIQLGQTIESFVVHAIEPDGEREIARGTTIGHCRLLRIPPMRLNALSVTLRSTLGPLRLATLSLHADAS